MKIPLILAETQVPGALPQAAPHLAIAGAQFGALAQVGSDLTRTGEIIGRVERMQREISARSAAKTARAQAELSLAQGDADLKLDVRDPVDYQKKWDELAQQVTKDTETTLDDDAKSKFREQWNLHLAAERAKTLTHRNTLFLEQDSARLKEGLYLRKQLASLTPPDQPEEFKRHVSEGVGMLEDAKQRLPATTVETMRKAWLDDVLTARALTDKNADPAGFLERARMYTGMDPKTLETFQQSARQRITADEQRANQEAERELKRIEKAAEDYRQGQLTELHAQAANPDPSARPTAADLQRARERRIIRTPAEQDTLNALINRKEERPSDPDLLRTVGADVRALRPTYTPQQIQAMMKTHAEGGRGINTTDGLMMIDRLRQQGEYLTSKADSDEGREHTRRGERYHAALQLGLSRLGITTPLEQVTDPVAKKLAADFRADLDARVNWLRRPGQTAGEEAIDIVNEVLPRYVEQQRGQNKLSYKTQAELMTTVAPGQIPPPDAMDRNFGGWYETSVQAAEAIKDKEPNLYARWKAQLQNLQRARLKVIDDMIRGQAQSGGSSSAPPPAQRGVTPPAQRQLVPGG